MVISRVWTGLPAKALKASKITVGKRSKCATVQGPQNAELRRAAATAVVPRSAHGIRHVVVRLAALTGIAPLVAIKTTVVLPRPAIRDSPLESWLRPANSPNPTGPRELIASLTG
ncbi:MAG: hypothetical protein C5B59_03985 [Bacteroidetes bacterium]|nr:MAG: hypothetical protein C5B59_03985 [Bacteroidota bacterium]